MPEPYQLDCTCGSAISIRLSQAGDNISCSSCGRSILVPRLTELKRKFSISPKPEPNQFEGFEEFNKKSTLACLLVPPILFLLMTLNLEGAITTRLSVTSFLTAYLAIPFLIYRSQMNEGSVGFFPQLVFWLTTGVVPGILLAITWDLIRYMVLRIQGSNGLINYSTNTVGVIPFVRP